MSAPASLRLPAGCALLIAGLVVVLPSPDEGDAALERQADCLWYSARNHRFYGVQARALAEPARALPARAVAPGAPVSTDDGRSPWHAFLAGPGREDCGAVDADFGPLAAELRERWPAAERRLRDTRPARAISADESRGASLAQR